VTSRRILLLARALDAGGSERQLAETAKALRGNGWDVHAGCFHDSGLRAQELRDAGIPVVRFPVRSFASLSAVHGFATFAQYVLRHRIALTHSFDMPLNIFGSFAARLAMRPAVVSSQRCYRELFTTSEQRLLRITDKLVDGIVVNCEAIRRHLIEDEHVPADRIYLCYNGINTRAFFPAPARPAEFLAPDAVVIGTVAVLRPEKGLPTLMEAFVRVHQQCPRTRLLVVGSGPLRQQLENMARSAGIAPCVHFQPSTEDVARWLNYMDVFVLPSLSEALSNSLMEAMACGIASIASKVGGNPELISEGETGMLFPSGDAAALASRIRQLVEDETLRRRLGAAAASFIASEMTTAKCAAQMASIYSRLLSR
jgi:glycosyltransferase involved in cell wall biosynthesis